MNIRFNDREKKIIRCIEEITGVTPHIVHEPEGKQSPDTDLFHIKNILILSSSYNYFLLEEEGRLSTLFTERQTEDNNIPMITHVESSEECQALLKKKTYDLLIIFNK